ncbi:MAG: ATP-binding protein [Verrucomicrobiota bacterium]
MPHNSFLRYLSWRRLRVQVIAICITTLTIALGGFTALSINQQKETLSEEYLNEARVLTENLSRSVVEWILNEDYDKLSETAQRTAKYSRVREISLFDLEGYPITFIQKNDIGEISEIFSLDRINIPEGKFKQNVDEHNITTWVAIESDSEIGWIRLESSLGELNAMITSLWRQGVSFLMFFLLLSVAIFWRFFDGPLKSIEDITEFASNMTGEHVSSLKIKHQTHETQKLAETLNATSIKLHKNLKDLESAKDDLSVKVHEKTQHLAETIVELQHEAEERKKAEAQLVHAQKMESVGQMAAGIAHEINTPIQFISSNLQFIQDSKEDLFSIIDSMKASNGNSDTGPIIEERMRELSGLLEEHDFEFIEEELPRAIDQSIEGTRRVSEIVQAMKTFSHPSTESLASASINKIVEDTVTLSKNEWKYVSELEMELAPDLPNATCSISEVSQVLLNLIVNAAHAIEECKKDKDSLEGRIKIKTWSNENEHVYISVEDNGAGIPEDAQRKIFDPFFTTKEVGKGTGQGLSICYDAIVNRHKGDITFTTERGNGTTFRIMIPCTQPESEPSTPA